MARATCAAARPPRLAETACARPSRAAWSWPSSQTRRCAMVLAFRPWGPGRPPRATPCGMLSATREPEGRCREFASCHVLPWLVDADREADARSAAGVTALIVIARADRAPAPAEIALVINRVRVRRSIGKQRTAGEHQSNRPVAQCSVHREPPLNWHFAFTAQLTGCSAVPADFPLFNN